MSLRTYPLVSHPAFLRFVEGRLGVESAFDALPPVDVPAHRPTLRKISDIGQYLDVSPEICRSIMRNKEHHYRTFYLKKRLGGRREISSPRTFLKVIQWWILDTILQTVYIPEFVHGFVRGRSYISNAEAHIGCVHILNVDIEDFFPSVRIGTVGGIFERLGYDLRVAEGLAELCTYEGVLPQGAPTSPMVANLSMSDIDIALRQISEGRGLTYTRYADDLTFSSKGRIEEDLLDEIQHVLNDKGFRLNQRKTKFMGMNQRREVTGLIVGSSGVSLPPETINAARGWFFSILKKPSDHADKFDRLQGTLELIRRVGGRGAKQVIEIGEAASAAILASKIVAFPASTKPA